MMEKEGWELERLVNEQQKARTSGGATGRLSRTGRDFPRCEIYQAKGKLFSTPKLH
jgi:hypothetical protein